MSLTTAKNGAVTLSKERHDVCMSAAYELDSIAEMLPDAVERTDEIAMASYLKVRCLAGRLQALSRALMEGLYDEAVQVCGVDGLRHRVTLTLSED